MTFKKFSLLTVVAVGLAFGYEATARNITIFDGVGGGGFGGGPRGVGLEDQEVELGATGSQDWDLEAFELSGKRLSVWSGYSLRNGNGKFSPGDIFFDVNGDARIGYPLARSVDNSYYRYDYVIHFTKFSDPANPNTLKYDVYALGNADKVLPSEDYVGDKFDWANPWRYDVQGSGSKTPLLSDQSATWVDNLTDADTLGMGPGGGVLAGGKHNRLTIEDISFLGDEGVKFLVHTTMLCGNDGMNGSGGGVADGGMTVTILGLSLFGLALLRRRVSK
jgi:hypothetical protein